MKTFRHTARFATLALLAGGVFTSPAGARTGESTDINKLLSEINNHAIQFRADSDMMFAFTRSNMDWESYAGPLQSIKDHISAAGKALARLNAERANGSPWQQTAIDRINPLMKELAANTEAVINTLNANRRRLHMKAFQDYVEANSELSANLAHMIGDFVDYGNTKTKLDRLTDKLELPEP